MVQTPSNSLTSVLQLRLSGRARYAVGVAAFSATLLIVLFLQQLGGEKPLAAGSAFMAAVVIASAFGGAGPGLLVIALSVAALHAIFVPNDSSWGALLEDELRLLVFAAVALLAHGLNIGRLKLYERLERSRETLSDFLENASVAMHWVGPDGSILWANQAELDMMGVTREEYLGHHIAQFHEDEGKIEDILLRLRRGEAIAGYATRLRRGDGRVLDVLIDCNALWEDGRFVHTRTFTRDVTARIAAETELKEQRRELEIILAGITDGITAHAPGGRIIYANDTAKRLIGAAGVESMEAGDLPGIMKSTEILTEDGRRFPLAEMPVLRALGGKGPSETTMRVIDRETGEESWIEVKALPMADASGRVQMAVNIFRDVSESRAAHEALLLSEEHLQREHAEAVRLYESETIARSRAEAAVRRTAALQAVAAALVEARTPQEAGAALLREGMAALDARMGRVLLVDEARGFLRPVASAGFEESPLLQSDIALTGEVPLAAAARLRKGLFVESPQDQARDFPDLIVADAIRSWAAIPVMVEERVIAVMGFIWSQERKFSSDEIDLIFAFGRLAAQALERARLYQSEQASRREAELASQRIAGLQGVTVALGETMTQAQVAEVVLREGIEAAGASTGLIALFDRTSAELFVAARRGFPRDVVVPHRYALNADVPLTRAVATGRAVYIRDGGSDAPQGLGAPALPDEQAWAVIPIIHNDEVFGALRFSWKERRSFQPEERHLLEALAGQTGQAFERARLYQSEQQSRRSAEQSAFQMARLHASRSALARALTPMDVAAVIVREGVAALQGRAGSVALISADGEFLDLISTVGDPAQALGHWRRLPLSQAGPFAEALRARSLLYFDSVQSLAARHPEMAGGGLNGAVALVPLAVDERNYGVFAVGVPPSGDLSLAEKDLLQAFANQGAQALDRARLYEDQMEARRAAEAAAERVSRLQSVTAALSEAVTTADVSAVFSERGLPATGARAGAIYHLNEASQELSVVARSGHPSIDEDARVLSLSNFPQLESVVHGSAPAFIRTADELDEAGRRMATRHGPQSLSWALLPLQLERRAIGMIGLSFEAPQEFGEPQRDLLITLGRQFGQALGRARLYEAERTLRERLNAVMSDIPGVVWETWGEPGREDQRTDFVSGYVEQMLGYTVEECLATPNFWLKIVHPEDLERVAAKAAEDFASGQPSINQFRWLRKDGRTLHVLAHSSVIQDDQGRPIGMRGVNLDVTERKRAEDGIELLVHASDILGSSLDLDTTLKSVAGICVPAIADWCAIDLVADGQMERVALVHQDGAKLELARGLERRQEDPQHLGRVREALRTLKPTLLREITPDLLEMVTDSDRRAIIQELGFRSGMLLPLVGRDEVLGLLTLANAESTHRFDAQDLALAEELGRRAGIAVQNARLYSESLQARSELQRSNQSKDEFLGLVSHELRTPITSIYGGARFLHLRAAKVDERTRDELILTMEQESEKLYRLVENLLALARMELGSEIPMEPVLLGVLAEKAANAFRSSHKEREVIVENEAQGVMAIGEPTYVEQVIQNFLSNAEKYSPPEEPISIKVTVDIRSKAVMVRVRDRGPGVPPDEIGLIFDSFYRSSTTSGKAPGKGLGLTVCKRLVEAQGGKIWARHRRQGGLEVGFSLPLAEPRPEGLEDDEATASGSAEADVAKP